ncbi:phosphonate ABC transporter, permease protein PhnE [Halalkalibacterium halodurans]|uniref:ABC transmembrane type-1 domain-containing protein n=1 Tax=Halalkalibacterium halodurans TaxID=86665 RepID=A0A0M0KDX4_ALKHA|nr:phosphonate ABC transporter, permease protein PhnE [Halalkalibacterium halodurans]MED3645426.1 phosphonate ABC transporter, permease protein PhnE [Halalkalibacterium halodurans]TES52091.1 phosphonate ABC transporter, permease protein PhnE [Halalkalibacterium halodurans]TPE69784.1 phosphonate ABC transporter, permease protein PhnE [Halalkalibacterium halodurans]
MSQWAQQKNRTTKQIIGFLAAVFFLYSMFYLEIVPERVIQSWERSQSLILGMFPPTLDEPIDVLGAALESLHVAVMGTVLGVIFSIMLACFAAKNLAPHWSVSYLVKGFAAFVRAVPALIWALLFIVAVGLGPIPGILALAVNSIGMLVKVYAEAIEEIDHGVIEALQATGANRVHVIMQGVIPTIMSAFISWSVFRFDVNIRYAAVLGIVGAGGIGWELVRASRVLAYDQVLGITLVIFAMIIVMEFLTRYLKQRSDLVLAKASN